MGLALSARLDVIVSVKSMRLCFDKRYYIKSQSQKTKIILKLSGILVIIHSHELPTLLMVTFYVTFMF